MRRFPTLLLATSWVVSSTSCGSVAEHGVWRANMAGIAPDSVDVVIVGNMPVRALWAAISQNMDSYVEEWCDGVVGRASEFGSCREFAARWSMGVSPHWLLVLRCGCSSGDPVPEWCFVIRPVEGLDDAVGQRMVDALLRSYSAFGFVKTQKGIQGGYELCEWFGRANENSEFVVARSNTVTMIGNSLGLVTDMGHPQFDAVTFPDSQGSRVLLRGDSWRRWIGEDPSFGKIGLNFVLHAFVSQAVKDNEIGVDLTAARTMQLLKRDGLIWSSQ
jgi:hypothetical protein